MRLRLRQEGEIAVLDLRKGDLVCFWHMESGQILRQEIGLVLSTRTINNSPALVNVCLRLECGEVIHRNFSFADSVVQIENEDEIPL